MLAGYLRHHVPLPYAEVAPHAESLEADAEGGKGEELAHGGKDGRVDDTWGRHQEAGDEEGDAHSERRPKHPSGYPDLCLLAHLSP